MYIGRDGGLERYREKLTNMTIPRTVLSNMVSTENIWLLYLNKIKISLSLTSPISSSQ